MRPHASFATFFCSFLNVFQEFVSFFAVIVSQNLSLSALTVCLSNGRQTRCIPGLQLITHFTNLINSINHAEFESR
jgi:hypothetical protein